MDLLLKNRKSNRKEKEECKNLMKIFFTIDKQEDKITILNEALQLDAENPDLLIQYGLILINSHRDETKEFIGYAMLEKAFNLECVPIHSYQGRWIATLIGRYNHLIHKYKTAERFLKLANSSYFSPDDLNIVQLATNISGYAESKAHASKMIREFHRNIDELLKKKQLDFTFVPYPDYNFIILSAFNFEIYYEANLRECMSKHYQLTLKVFPELNYISPHIKKSPANEPPYKLGIVSAFFTKNNSVIADFGGVMRRLPRDKFNITFIYLVENPGNGSFVYPDENHIIIETYKNPNWLAEARKSIEALELDLLFYLDSTMSSVVQRTMMSRLAPKQAVSHGHPVTSGIPSDIMDYFISWEEAEIPTAQEHYTENLILLRKGYMHQYYNTRIDAEGNSVINGKPYRHITREYFSKYVNPDKNWYVCMQKPFKLHPEFDSMLEKIANRDPLAIIILHDINDEENKSIFLRRYNKFIDKVAFIPMLNHDELMALYVLSDVILDSYYAGGCTTTREALEVGAIVVTLPAKYLGGRWSLAYYNIMGMTDLIARNKDEYIELALKYGTNIDNRLVMKRKILDNVGKLFYRQEAVDSWVEVFQTILLKNN